MTIQDKKPIIALLNFVLFAAVVYVNTLAVTLPLNGKSTGELSDQYPNLFVPAGFTFSIWGVIYLLLLLFVVYQIYITFNKKSVQKLSIQSQGLFGLTCLLNMAWIVAWHYEMIGMSVIIMLCFLATLILFFINIEKTKISSLLEIIAIETPINVYLGWISVATIANITALLVDLGWKGGVFSESAWTIILLTLGSTLAIFMLLRKSNYAYAMVIIWAYYGIFSKRQTSENPEIAQFSLLLMGIIALVFAFQVFKRVRKTF